MQRGNGMKHNDIFKILFIALIASLLISDAADARLFHAASKAAIRNIMKRGIRPSKFKSAARFGKGFYSSKAPKTALAEKGGQKTLIRLKESAYLKNNTLNFRNPSSSKLRAYLGRKYDLRGAVKKNIIGPKAGCRLGRIAGTRGKIIKYRSVRNGGTNLFVPKKIFGKKPKIVRPEKITNVR
jgi:hypothetical protein